MKNRIPLAIIVLNRPIFANKFESLNNDKLIHYAISANNKIPKTMFDEKF